VSASPVVAIRPSRRWVPVRLGDLWAYRELLYFLVWRDVKVRYKQTVLGASWAIIQPFFTMVVFSVIFGHFGRIPSDGVAYPVFAFCGLLPWQLFAHALAQSGNSLVASQGLITKVYFPRLVIPLAAMLGGLVDFAVAFVVLIAMMAYYGTLPTLAIAALPLFLVFNLATAFAVGLWLSALNVQFRDVRYALPFLAQFWLFATPVAYPASLLPPQWRGILAVNPMTGVVEGFRWALLGTPRPPVLIVAVSAGIVVALLVTGLFYFRRMEQTFADVV
jgi:homopolymeric O-antigen transport system permease protein